MERYRLVGIGILLAAVLLLLILILLKHAVDEQGAFLCAAVERDPTTTMDECPAHNSNTSWLIMAGFGLAAILLAVGAVQSTNPALFSAAMARARRTPAQAVLDADEQRIVALIEQAEGGAYQSDLITKSGFSKVKMTRVLDRLETKGVIERRRRGMTNLVLLR